MGIMRAGLTNESYDRSYTNRELFGRIAAYFRPSTPRMALLTVLVTVISLAGALQPVLVAWGVGVIDSSRANRDLIAMLLVVGVLVIGVVNWGLNWARRMLTVKLLGDVVLAMRTDAFRAVMNHDMSFFDKYQSGRIVSRITSDTDEFSRVAVLLTELFSQVLLVVILVAYLFTDQLAIDAGADPARAGGVYRGQPVPQLGTPRHAPEPASRRRCQRQHSGSGYRDCCLQELPA